MGSSCLYPPEITLQFAFSSSSIASPYPSPFPLGSRCSHKVFSHWVIWSLFVTTANSSRQKILLCHSLSSLDINKDIAVHIINHHKCMPGITKGHGVHVIVELKQPGNLRTFATETTSEGKVLRLTAETNNSQHG